MAGVEAFIGSWREEEKTGFEEMADKLDLSAEKKQFYKASRTEISYKKDGDQWTIDVGIQGIPQTRTFQLKLGEPYKSASLDGSPLDSMMVADGDMFQETHKDESGMEMKIERCINGGKMVVISESLY